MAEKKDPLERIEETARRLDEAARKIDEDPRLVRAVQTARGLLPSRKKKADRESTASRRPGDLLARYLEETRAGASGGGSAAKELGQAASQVFEAIQESRDRRGGQRDLAILFTDLVGFSSWALEAGDADAVELLREVEGTVEPAIKANGGSVVKRLGDGCMAVFTGAADAVRAALEAQSGLPKVKVAGYTPELRAGIHVGRPRKQSGDYLGIDVNIAARVADAATGGQVLVSEPVREAVEDGKVAFRKRGRLGAKGAPEDLDVYSVKLR